MVGPPLTIARWEHPRLCSSARELEVGIDYAVRVQQIGFLVKIMKGAGEGKALPNYGRARNGIDPFRS